MTIAGRNRARFLTLALMFIISVLTIIFGIIGFLNIGLQSYSGFKNLFLPNFFLTQYKPQAVFLTIVFMPVLSVSFLSYIYLTFRNTHAMEISFFLSFIFAIGLESLRLVFILYNSSKISFETISLISRIVCFSRLTAIFSLFMGSIYSQKILTRQIFYVLLVMFFLAFLLTTSIPISNFNVNKFFLFGERSFSYKFMLWLASLLACLNYFFSYKAKKDKEYLHAAIGTVLLIIGYWLLIYTSCYLFLILGLSLFITGSIKFIRNIHSYHLWD